jgi:hypothetical protein
MRVGRDITDPQGQPFKVLEMQRRTRQDLDEDDEEGVFGKVIDHAWGREESPGRGTHRPRGFGGTRVRLLWNRATSEDQSRASEG